MQSTMVRAVASPRRAEILRLVWDRELPAGEIARHFDVSWPAISQNLGVLRQAGAITERREGTRRWYRADQRALGPLADVVRAMWTERLDVLAELAEAAQRGGS
ncbi:MAG: metalloregulator ArsR/SmtB family transcription factor [Candidatus Limnocylindrales bacterium]